MNSKLRILATALFALALPASGVLGCTGADSDDQFRADGESGDEFDGDCTLTQGYWKNHNAYASNPSQAIPWPISEDTELCEMTYLEILETPPKGDAWFILAHQYIAALLNQASGASIDDDLDAALTSADDLLGNCAIAAEDRPTALDLADMFDAFNNGELESEHCDDGGHSEVAIDGDVVIDTEHPPIP